MYNHKIINADTGEEIIVPMSSQEIALIEANIAKTNLELQEQAIKAEAVASAVTKLEALGLTAEEIAALRG